MSLLFGNLTQSFVNFGIAVNDAKNNATAQMLLPAAADHFRTTAASDAADLVYIGTSLVCFLTGDWMDLCMRGCPNNARVDRCRHVCVHVYLHVHLGLHRRGQCETDP